MVYWTGYNSSVILILTKLFDFNLGTVTDSSLWRSLDLGSSYEKLNDRMDSRLVLSYLYVCPSNNRKILLVSDPEMDSSVVVSSDEGNSFQRLSISFTIQSLLFHPVEDDWLLAYSQEQKLYFSEDFGRNWNLVHESVSPGRFYWAVSGLDEDSDLVHLEAQDPSGLLRYITCLAGSCPDSRKFPFFGRIDEGSLVVQDDYVFVQVTTVGPTKYFVSYQRQPFQSIQLPKYCLPKDMHIISTEGQVLAGVQQWDENDTYSLYMSDRHGNYFSPALTYVRISRSVAGILNMDVYKVAGVSGVLLANRREGGRVRTFISFSQGQMWRLLIPPATEPHCSLPSCSLHLHLRMSESPYSPDSIISSASAPGLIIATGTVGSELTNHNTRTFLSSDAGNTWRQVFDKEQRVWFLEDGGALLAITQASVPISHLWLSIDEGRSWLQYRFSASPLFVDGVLMEQDTHHHIITFFGHLSHRSDWQLIKVNYRNLFNRQCTSEDYQIWPLLNQGEPCVMGQRQNFRKRRPGSRCILGRRYLKLVSAESCSCAPYDFECDYGFERQLDGICSPAFWYQGSGIGTNCTSGQISGYRKVVTNSCDESVEHHLGPRMHQCDATAPNGVRLSTTHSDLTARPHTNVTFLIHTQQVYSSGLDVQLDLGDGVCVSPSVLKRVSDSTTHVYTHTNVYSHTYVYTHAGIYRVSAHVRNHLGADDSQLFLHVTSPVEQVILSAPRVLLLGKHTNLSALVLPDIPKTAVYYWWIDNSTEPVVTLEGWLLTSFHRVGVAHVSLQVSSEGVVRQDSSTIIVTEVFRSMLLTFSPNLEEHNPAIPEWREDLSRVVMATISQVNGLSSDWLLVCVLPGPPTAAEVFLLPPVETNSSHTHTHTSQLSSIDQELEKMSKVLVHALNQNWVEFLLRPEVRITARLTHLGLASQVGSDHLPGISVLLLFLSMAAVGVVTFFMYRFKRNMPWIQVQSDEPQQKGSDVMDTGRQSVSSSRVQTESSSPRISLNHVSPIRALECGLQPSTHLKTAHGAVTPAGGKTHKLPNCTNV